MSSYFILANSQQIKDEEKHLPLSQLRFGLADSERNKRFSLLLELTGLIRPGRSGSSLPPPPSSSLLGNQFRSEMRLQYSRVLHQSPDKANV